MNKKKILFVLIGFLIISVGVIFFMRQKAVIKLSNIKINTSGWVTVNEKNPRIITGHGMGLMISEDNKVTFEKLVDFNKSHNIPFEIKNFDVGGRTVAAIQKFDTFSTIKSTFKIKTYDIYIPPHIVLKADVPIDEKTNETEIYLRKFLATDIKFLK